MRFTIEGQKFQARSDYKTQYVYRDKISVVKILEKVGKLKLGNCVKFEKFPKY